MIENSTRSIENPNQIKNYWIKEKKTVILLTLFGILYNVGMVARPIYQGKLIDALTAAPLAGKQKAPIVLATNNVSTAQVETAELKLKNVTKMTQIGQGITKTVVEKLYDVLNLFNK